MYGVHLVTQQDQVQGHQGSYRQVTKTLRLNPSVYSHHWPESGWRVRTAALKHYGRLWTQGLISGNMEKVWVHSSRRAQIHFEQENVKPPCSKGIMKHVRRRINGTQTISTTVTQDDPRSS